MENEEVKQDDEPKKPDITSDDYESYREVEEGKPGAVLGYIPFLCFIPLVLMRDNKFAVKHGKQGLLLFLVEIIAVIFLLPGVSEFFWKILLVICIIIAIIGIIHGFKGRDFKVPYISDFVQNFRI
ncbi:MAG: hypothetical protein GY855_04030 [candidate division Zixibacteria bacterium]|nr:hypothetical protein [candidate division Zixibacteria bacterium]